MRKLIFTSLLYFLFSCNKSNNDNKELCQEYFLGQYRFCIPNNWIDKKNTNYDSKSFLFVNKRDSIVISSGITNIIDDPIVVNSEKEKQTLIEFSNGELSSTDVGIYTDKDFDIFHSTYLKNYYYYDKINNINVLLFFPKKQNGTAGGIFNKGLNGNELSIYCNNPSPETQQLIKKLFQTVKIK